MGLLDSSLEVMKLAGKIANPELVQAATKANIEALELSQANIELQKKVSALQDQVTDLEGKLKLTGEVFRDGGFVYLEGDPDGFCSRCWEVDHKLVHIIQMPLERTVSNRRVLTARQPHGTTLRETRV